MKGTHSIPQTAVDFWKNRLLNKPETQEQSIERQRNAKRIERFNQQQFRGFQNV